MTLETLFSQAEQGRAFLLMVLSGLAMGMLLTAAHRLPPGAARCGDALGALLITLALGQVVLWTGTIRLYALLGTVIGAAIYLGVISLLGNRKKPSG